MLRLLCEHTGVIYYTGKCASPKNTDHDTKGDDKNVAQRTKRLCMSRSPLVSFGVQKLINSHSVYVTDSEYDGSPAVTVGEYNS